jgi:tetratricopeptide (TPR) repeat protein
VTSNRQSEMRRICQETLERPPSERGRYLADACGGDETLRREVEALLAHDVSAETFLSSPAFDVAAQQVAAADSDLRRAFIGRTLSRYSIVSELGAGGMGVVYKAIDTRLERQVALKLIAPGDSADTDSRRRFVGEARAASQLNHPNIVSIHDVDEDGGVLFLVMELVDGQPLDDLISQAGLPVHRALDYALQIADALATAHAAGIVHRDVKPGNIMVSDSGRVKVLDFGLAKRVDAHAPNGVAATGTARGVVLGTVAYMSPEQAQGLPIDARSDVFSFGAVLYEMLAGVRAFGGTTQLTTLAAILTGVPPPLTSRRSDLPADLVHLVNACLEKHAAVRPTMPDVAHALNRIREADSSHLQLTPAGRTQRPLAGLELLFNTAERTPFVGRDAEMAELKRLLDRTLTGQGGIVMIGGEPGVGKTRLARELLREAWQRGCTCLTGHCYEMEGAPPFVPFIELTEQAVRLVPQAARMAMGNQASEIAVIVPSLRRSYADIPPLPEVPANQQRRLIFGAFLEYLQRGTQQSPEVLLLDDLHWADEPTLQLLLHLAPRVSSMRLLVISTYRDGELYVKGSLAKTLEALLRQRLTTRVALRGLSEPGVEQMVAAMSPSSPPLGLARAIFGQTEGNPFFVEEVYQHLAEEGKLSGDAAEWKANLRVDSVVVPEGVRLVIGHRLERLRDGTRGVLTAAAVIGRTFALDILQAVVDAPEDMVLDVIEEAERAQFVAAQSAGRETRYGFVHELIRAALVNAVSLPRRQRLHLKIADAIERLRAASLDSHASVLAHHLYHAGSAADGQRTARALLVAGRRALGASAFEEALEAFETVIGFESNEAEPVMGEVYERRGFALIGLHRLDSAAESFERALERCISRSDNAGIVRAAGAAFACHAWRLQQARAREVAIRGAAAVDPALAEHATLQALVASVPAPSQVAESLDRMRVAEDVARQHGDPGVLGRVLFSKANLAFSTGRVAQTIEVVRIVDTLASHLPSTLHADLQWLLVLATMCRGQFEAAEAMLPELERRWRRSGNQGGQWVSRSAPEAIRFARSGDIPAYLDGADALLEQLPHAFTFLTRTRRAMCLAYIGRMAEAVDELTRASTEEPVDHPWSGIVDSAFLALAAVSGDTAAARTRLRSVVDRLPTPGEPNVQGRWLALLSIIPTLILLEARDECAALYQSAVQLLSTGMVWSWLSLGPMVPQLAAGIAAHAGGRTDTAREHFEQARRIAHEIPDRVLQPTVDYWYGRMLRESAEEIDRSRGRAMLESAVADFRTLGMVFHTRLAERAIAGHS